MAMQQIQLLKEFSFLGSKRPVGAVLSVLPDKAKELIDAKLAIAYSEPKVEPKVEKGKAKEVTVNV